MTQKLYQKRRTLPSLFAWKRPSFFQGLFSQPHNGRIGEVYNIGGHNEMRNIDIVRLICRNLGKSEGLIQYVTDRKGHNLRYAVDPTKIEKELGWEPSTFFQEGD